MKHRPRWKIAARWLGFSAGFLAIIFVPAGTFNYWQAWVLLGVYAFCGTLLYIYMLKHNRALLELRMKQGPHAERSSAQRIIVTLLYAGVIGEFVLSAFDHRFGWSAVPVAVVILGNAIVVLGFYFYFITMRVNNFASGAVEISTGQRVISNGPYAVVRHPMYVGLLLVSLGIPLALGSYVGLTIFAALIPVVVWRLTDEEHFLIKNLPGYADYRVHTRWRLVPRIF